MKSILLIAAVMAPVLGLFVSPESGLPDRTFCFAMITQYTCENQNRDVIGYI